MYEIVAREDFTERTFLLEVGHPMLAHAAAPGQFVMVRLHEAGERIPLTIADFDREKGTITLVIQAVGKTTLQMQRECFPGGRLAGMMGPLGAPSHIREGGKIVCVGGGLGVAPVFPILRAHKEAGAFTVGVIGFRSAELAFWEDRFRRYADELVLVTDDGSAGLKGTVGDGLKSVLSRDEKIDEVVAIGPPIMMKACAGITRPLGIRTTVSLNPIMVDGTGMCGGCRVTVGGKIKFGCVDGPDFDGHQVDFDELIRRLGRFRRLEREAIERWEAHRQDCRLMGDREAAAR